MAFSSSSLCKINWAAKKASSASKALFSNALTEARLDIAGVAAVFSVRVAISSKIFTAACTGKGIDGLSLCRKGVFLPPRSSTPFRAKLLLFRYGFSALFADTACSSFVCTDAVKVFLLAKGRDRAFGQMAHIADLFVTHASLTQCS